MRCLENSDKGLEVMGKLKDVVRKIMNLRNSSRSYVVSRIKYFILFPWLKYVCPPRVLNYHYELNAMILRGFGAKIGYDNVRILSPITLHRSDLKTDFSNLSIADDCVLNGNHFLDVTGPVTLERGVSLGPGVIVMSHNRYNGNPFLEDRLNHTCGIKPVLFKEGAGIKAGAIVVMGVTVGKHAVVAAQAVVNRDVADKTFVAGVPAKLVKEI